MNGLEIKPTKKREKLRVLNSAGGLYTISVVPLSAKHTVLACSQVMQGEATEGRRARVEIDVAFFAFVVGLSRSFGFGLAFKCDVDVGIPRVVGRVGRF